MKKIKLSIALLLLFVLLSIVFSLGAGFIYAEALKYVLGAGLIISVLFVVLFLIYSKNKEELS